MFNARVLFVLIIYTAQRLVLGCSPPVGGFVEPAPEDIVSYADIVAVGEVSEILPLDPLYGDSYENLTYGAMVNVFCSYKGGPLPPKVKIGGVGFVPGHCFSKDLKLGQQYVLFLSNVTFTDNNTRGNAYEQTSTAVPKTKLGDFLGVCDLNMQYPAAGGMAINRSECPPATKLSTCKRPVVKGGAVAITSSLTFLVLFLANVV